MKKYIFFLFLFFGTLSYSQSGDKRQAAKRHRKIVLADSLEKKIQRLKDSITTTLPLTNSDKIHQDISSNIDSLVRIQNEQKEKKKKQAIKSIAIGVALFVLLIIGLRRRKKQESRF